MGLCKCPKKKVTNQFCFEHRVNVCEHCMVDEHPTCIVQSYLQWLDDSDYNPVCRICDDQLGTTDCIRLVCYDVFHTECLNDWASRLPPNTAPAGYKCPTCSSPVFPASNLVSPIADHMREVLAAFPWARAGLELPLIDDVKNSSQEWSMVNGSALTESESNEQGNRSTVETVESQAKTADPVPQKVDSHSRVHSPGLHNAPSSINSTSSGTVTNSGARVTAVEDPPVSTSQFRGDVHHPSAGVSRKPSSSEVRLFLNTDADKDADENKYKRRSTIEWFSRWWRTMSRPPSRHHQSLIGGNRRRMIVLLVVLAVISVIVVLSYFGQGVSDDDPLLDPFNNPNIRIEGE